MASKFQLQQIVTIHKIINTKHNKKKINHCQPLSHRALYWFKTPNFQPQKMNFFMISSRLHHLVNVIHNTGRPQVPVFHLLQAQNRASTPNQTPKSAFFQHTNNKSTTTQHLNQHAHTTNPHNPNRPDSQLYKKKKNSNHKTWIGRDLHTTCMTPNKNAQIFPSSKKLRYRVLKTTLNAGVKRRLPPTPNQRYSRKRTRSPKRTAPMRRRVKLGSVVEPAAAAVAGGG